MQEHILLQIEELEVDISIKNSLINNLKTVIEEKTLPLDTLDLIEFYNTKQKVKDITYKGLEIENKQFKLVPEIKVCDFIHITKSMKDILKDNNLIFTKKKTPRNISEHMWKIYVWFVTQTKYIRDIHLYGREEHWLSNFEQIYMKRFNKFYGDCENLANLCCAFIIA